MSFSLSSRFFVIALGSAALLFAAACTTPTSAPPPELSALTYDGSKQALLDLDREIAAAGHDEAQLTAIANRLIGTLRNPAATFAARQAVAQRLSLFPAATLLADGNAALFAGLLTDDAQVDLARLALDQVPGSAVDALFVEALETAAGKARLAIVQSLGNRRVAAAAAPLTPLLRNDDPTLAAAAAHALGQIGTADALAALRGTQNVNAPTIVEATLTAAHHVGGPEAARAFQQIADATEAPPHLRAAASRSLLMLEPADAPEHITAALASDDAALKPVVIEAIASHPSADLVPTLGTHLAAWDAATQTAVIAALARKGDARAVPALATAATHTDAAVRRAAIDALGFRRGDAKIADQLATIADGADAEDARLARQSLARLTGPGVSDTILTNALDPNAAHRLVFIGQLASRYMIEAVPALLELRADPDAAVRAAALGSLAEIAPASTQPAILEWTVVASDSGEQSRALRALAEVTLRNPDVAQRAAPIIAVIAKADSALARRLLPVLPRIGGTAAAEAAAALALRDDPALANAAVATLSRWTDQAGLGPLVGVAEKGGEATRRAAVQSAIRFLERYRAMPDAELVDSLSRLLEVARDTGARQRLVFLLGRARDERALTLAKKLQAEPALAAEAADAAEAIAANLAGPVTGRASSNSGNIKNIFDGDTSNRWVTSAEPGRWIEIDFQRARPLRQVILDQSSHPDNMPEHLEIFVTDDPAVDGEVRASVDGTQDQTVIDLPPDTHGRYLIIRHTAERVDGWWSISELYFD